MDKKGFTLVELLGVIAILGLIAIIVSTNGFGLLNKTKDTINKVEEDNLMEAARVFLVEVDKGICGDTAFCNKNYINKTVKVPIWYFIVNGYFKDDANHCDTNKYLNLKIEQDDDGNTTGYKVEKYDEEDIICKN